MSGSCLREINGLIKINNLYRRNSIDDEFSEESYGDSLKFILFEVIKSELILHGDKEKIVARLTVQAYLYAPKIENEISYIWEKVKKLQAGTSYKIGSLLH